MKKTILILICVLLSTILVDASNNLSQSKKRKYLKEAIFVAEEGDRSRFSKKWKTAPKLNLDRVEEDYIEFCQNSFDDIVSSCHWTNQSSEIGGEIVIHIGKKRELQAIVEKLDLDMEFYSDFHWMWWNEEKVITRAVVFIASDKLNGDEIKDKILEHIFSTFGFLSKTNAVKETCVSEKN